MSTELITADLVDLQLDQHGGDQAAVVRSLAQRLADGGRVTDLDQFLSDVWQREGQMPTGLEGGVGIPHCRSAAVTAPTLAFGRSEAGVDFGAEDGPAQLIFLIAAPEGGDADHMSVLAALARRLVRAQFKQTLLESTDPSEVAKFISTEVTP